MVGDWVYNKHHRKNIRLTQYDFFTHTHNEFGEQELAPFAKPTIGKDLEPIPLTPEILEKNGVKWLCSEPSGRKTYCCNEPWISCTYFPDSGWLVCVGAIGSFKKTYAEVSTVQYVHQLQHALKLCGIDKEIEL